MYSYFQRCFSGVFEIKMWAQEVRRDCALEVGDGLQRRQPSTPLRLAEHPGRR